MDAEPGGVLYYEPFICGVRAMIRRLQKTDIDAVAQIWLTSNREAHDFVPAEYWESNFTPVKEMLLQAEVYVCEDEESNEIRGFIGLEDEYIAGVFVRKEARSKGTGKALLDYVKEIKRELTLHVYVKKWQYTYRAAGRGGLLAMGESHATYDFETPMKYARG